MITTNPAYKPNPEWTQPEAPAQPLCPCGGAHAPSVCPNSGGPRRICSLERGPAIARVFDRPDDLEALANARLIAAAPDLLVALEALVEVADCEGDLTADAYDAIAKAKGGSK